MTWVGCSGKSAGRQQLSVQGVNVHCVIGSMVIERPEETDSGNISVESSIEFNTQADSQHPVLQPVIEVCFVVRMRLRRRKYMARAIGRRQRRHYVYPDGIGRTAFTTTRNFCITGIIKCTTLYGIGALSGKYPVISPAGGT